MSKPLIRFARRLSSWEPEIAEDDFLKAEFSDRNREQPDLRPSVYEIEASAVVQAFAEHATAFEPPSAAGGVDLGGTGRAVESTLGETGFSFTMNAHRELILEDRNELLALVLHVRVSLIERTHHVSMDQVREYVRSRLAARDEEWQTAQADSGAKKWLRKIKT